MARLFDNAQNEYLQVTTTPITAAPLTVSCWFYSDDTTAYQVLFGLRDVGGATHTGWRLALRGDMANDPLQSSTYDDLWDELDTGPAGYSANTWHHACLICAAVDDRKLYLDGGNEATSAVSRTPLGVDGIEMGLWIEGGHFSGMICDVGLWNVAVSSSEKDMLAANFSPLFVKPQNLVAYWPLIRNDNDGVGGYNMTAYSDAAGPTWAGHAPIIMPAPVFYSFPSVAAGGLSIPRPLSRPFSGPFGGI